MKNSDYPEELHLCRATNKAIDIVNNMKLINVVSYVQYKNIIYYFLFIYPF